jgi:putative PIN family toxin of toxin-antitoxin system
MKTAIKKISTQQFNSLISGVAAFVSDVKVIFPIDTIELCRDPEDNMLLECCKAVQADYLITSDRDLLDIGKLPFNLKIITPRQFLLFKEF